MGPSTVTIIHVARMKDHRRLVGLFIPGLLNTLLAIGSDMNWTARRSLKVQPSYDCPTIKTESVIIVNGRMLTRLEV